MSNPKVHIIGGHGIGDCLLSIKAGDEIGYSFSNYDVINYLFVRDEVFRPLSYLFSHTYTLIKCDEDTETDSIRLGGAKLDKFKQEYNIGPDELVYTCFPDQLYGGPLAFDYKKFKTSPEAIRNNPILRFMWEPSNLIFLSLNTTTAAYDISGRIPQIIKQVALANPSYQIYYNHITNWNGQTINKFELGDLPSNVIVFKDQSFIESLKWLERSCYCLTIDNGVFHISKSMSMPVTLLDVRLGSQGLPWVRWRYSSDDSIHHMTDSIRIAKLIKTNLEIPATSLLPRSFVVENLDTDWKQALLLKEY